MYEAIIVSEENGLGKIIFNRPEKYNAFNEEMLKEIRHAMQSFEKNAAIKVITLEGAGKAFSTGQDLSEVEEDMDHGEVIRELYTPLVHSIDQSEKLIIAKVNGVAAGAGMSIALACDFRWMSEDAMMTSAFINVGLVPDSGHIFYLTRLAGKQKALEISLYSPKLSAREAYELGIADELIETDKFEAVCRNKTDQLLTKPSVAVGLIKQLTKRASDISLMEYMNIESEYQRLSGLSSDHQEGINAFKNKRKPKFKGE